MYVLFEFTQKMFEVYSMNCTKRQKWKILNVCGYFTKSLSTNLSFLSELEWQSHAARLDINLLPRLAQPQWHSPGTWCLLFFHQSHCQYLHGFTCFITVITVMYIHIWYFDQRSVYRDVYVYTEFII